MSADTSTIAYLETPALPTPHVPALPQDVDLAEYALGDTPRPRRTTKRIQRASRRAEAFALRRNGVSTAAIAQHLGVHPRTVSTWIRDAIQAIPAEEADAIRTLELERLDAIMAPQMRLALAGDGFAVDRVLRIMERRARLLGLDSAKPGGFEQVGALLDRLVLGE
ncbi:helix-turn-helix domain-containing protein [Microbacterium maritypicum]|uniref:helix-turn-helix domain-containing protein n=1 Tax=Microbacterium maritypicum TaxID=33918 RepID=UPI0038275A65